jgi:hypothetical protein
VISSSSFKPIDFLLEEECWKWKHMTTKYPRKKTPIYPPRIKPSSPALAYLQKTKPSPSRLAAYPPRTKPRLQNLQTQQKQHSPIPNPRISLRSSIPLLSSKG